VVSRLPALTSGRQRALQPCILQAAKQRMLMEKKNLAEFPKKEASLRIQLVLYVFRRFMWLQQV